MNLRLDKDSIRIRIKLDEAKKLSETGCLQEMLPWGTDFIRLEIKTKTEILKNIERMESHPGLGFFIATSELDRLIKNLGSLTQEKYKINNKNISILFEIDQFSYPKIKN